MVMSHDSTLPSRPYVTALAHPNIALVKYWGKRPGEGNLPAVGSLSITLDTLLTRTTLTLDPALTDDSLTLGDRQVHGPQAERARAFLRRVRALAGRRARPFAHVVSVNNFPTGAGLASSASGFAALALAATQAYGVTLTEPALSALARTGSGSAARSIFGGYARMARGHLRSGRDAVASPLLAPEAWPLRVVVAICHRGVKDVGSTEGMERTRATSPYWASWVQSHEQDLTAAQAAIEARDFSALAQVSEHSCMKMHALAMSAVPKLLYWRPGTLAALHTIEQLKANGVPVFATMDAGPQLKAVCLPEASEEVARALRETEGVQQVVDVGLGRGAWLEEPAS